jgi:hypothetical protein
MAAKARPCAHVPKCTVSPLASKLYSVIHVDAVAGMDRFGGKSSFAIFCHGAAGYLGMGASAMSAAVT